MKKIMTAVVAGCALALSPNLASAEHRGGLKDGHVGMKHSFSGVHLGMAVGFSSSDLELIQDLFLDATDYQLPQDYDVLRQDGGDAEDITGTITLGYDHEIGSQFLLGAFVDFTFGPRDGGANLFYPTTGVVGPVQFPNGFEAVTLEVKDQWGVGGRIGFLPRHDLLLFVDAGYTQADVEIRGERGFLESEADGYFVGAGLAYALGNGLEITASYRFSDFDEEELGSIDQLPCCAERLAIELDDHAFRIGLAYRFPIRRAARPVSFK